MQDDDGDEHGGSRMPKRRRSDRHGRCRTAKSHHRGKRLYLVLDDWAWGYTIREMDLSPASGERRRRRQRLPRPLIRLEAPRGSPGRFAAVGTRILATHMRRDPGYDDDGHPSIPGGFLPIVDVHSRAVHFGPGREILHAPIFFPVGDDDLYALDIDGLMKLSLSPLWPPRLEFENRDYHQDWAWECHLLSPPFRRMYIASYAMHPDGATILVSTAARLPMAAFPSLGRSDDDGGAAATFALDTRGDKVWARHGEWTMPFTGRAHFVRGLNGLVGLSDDPDTAGRLCVCEGAVTGGGERPPWKVSKETLFSEDPSEVHVGATLIYMGGGGTDDDEQLCLVQCVGVIGDDDDDDDQVEEEVARRRPTTGGYRYRVTTFSLSYDSNGDLTTGETCRVRCYKVPRESAAMASFVSDPAVFWL